MLYNEYLINDLRNILLERNETIAVAESVTSGNIQAALSIGADASKYFQGGMTLYNIGQKVRHLNVEPIEAQGSNCISRKVSTTMALEIAKKFTSDFGVSITGYASIVPENEEDGLYAFVAASYKGNIIINEKVTTGKDRLFDIQVDYTNQVLKLLLNWINNNQI